MADTWPAGEGPARRLPVGAEWDGQTTSFRVWAPDANVDLVVFPTGAVPALPLSVVPDGGRVVAFDPQPGGYHLATAVAPPGTRYGLRVGGRVLPDPASRFQPIGPFGPSEVVDPGAFVWSDEAFVPPMPHRHVVYEIHLGTFTAEGTWAAGARHLPRLGDLGVTTVEVLPVADFAGRFGWGYDGVCPFAPSRLYGRPDDFRRFVDDAHRAGVAVVLDVVYNHLGPSGSFLTAFSSGYLTSRHATAWGPALNFDGEGSDAVRAFFVASARAWVAEYHLDGLRFDATQTIVDDSPRHVLSDLTTAARDSAHGGKSLFLMAENDDQDARLLEPVDPNGMGFDAAWNDDFHHSAVVAATGRNEAYLRDFDGSALELAAAVRWGYLYQGQASIVLGTRRGRPALGLGPRRFVHYLENHDQVSNSLRGTRLHRRTTPGRNRALTALLLLQPAVPLLFQGQEFAASAPFVFFADHETGLAQQVREGRASYISQFPSSAAALERLPDPGDVRTFRSCVVDHGEWSLHREHVSLHRDLLKLRRTDPVLSSPTVPVETTALAHEALAVRWIDPDGADRLLLVNLGPDGDLHRCSQPLVAPPGPAPWRLAWSSEDPRYGGQGTPMADDDTPALPGHAALLYVAG